MAKKLDIDPRKIDYVLGSVGFIFPRTESELDNFNKYYSAEDFDFGFYTLNPDKAFTQEVSENKNRKIKACTKLKSKTSKNTYFKRVVLAAEITSELYNEPTFGSIKLQKLMFLCENIENMNINFEYSKQVAGPYDNKFMHSISLEFLRQQWFKIEKEKCGKFFRNVFMPLKDCGKHKIYYDRYFNRNHDKIKWFIDTFRKEKTDRVELIATLYACWMELKSQRKVVNDESLLSSLYSWSKEKEKYTRLVALDAISWMKENNVVPHRE